MEEPDGWPERRGADAEEDGLLRVRLSEKDRRIRELYEEVATLRLEADEARARAEAAGVRMGDLEEERQGRRRRGRPVRQTSCEELMLQPR